jgi:hypothetical protein
MGCVVWGGLEALSPVQLWKWAVAVASFQQLSGNRTILVSHIAFVFEVTYRLPCNWLLVALNDETYKATFARNKWFTYSFQRLYIDKICGAFRLLYFLKIDFPTM